MSHLKIPALKVFQTAKDSPDRFRPVMVQPVNLTHSISTPSVYINPRIKFQFIEGFGGAFTESAASTLASLSPELKNEILKAYFDQESGNGYSLCRTHINSCDFSNGNYALDDVPGDHNLNHFSIDRDKKHLIPMIHDAQKISKMPLKIFASPWSPPGWMKTNGKMNQGGKLLPEYRETWANYYCKFVKAYEKEQIPIWGLTVQNEPEAIQSWDSCIYTSEEERDFVRDFLGPALNRHDLGHLKLMIWDHNRDRIYERAKVVYDDPEAAKYVWGTAFHWYCSDNFKNLDMHHFEFPDKKLLFSEGCVEHGPHEGSWESGERYGHHMIEDLNRNTVGWVDWNLLLNENGGPNHAGNYCSAPILANAALNKIYYQSSYFYIGHFSRFIRPGAQRILSGSTRDELETTAFINTDGTIALVVLNRTENIFKFTTKTNGFCGMVDSPPRSISTIIIEGSVQ